LGSAALFSGELQGMKQEASKQGSSGCGAWDAAAEGRFAAAGAAAPLHLPLLCCHYGCLACLTLKAVAHRARVPAGRSTVQA